MAAHTLSPYPDPVKRWALYALIVVTSVAMGAWSLWEPLGRDQGIHATIAAGLLNGQVTYADIYNIKPPVTTAVHALSQMLFGADADAIRWFDLGLTAASLAALCALLLHLGFSPLAAFLAPLGFASLYYQLSFWMRGQTDGWAGMLLIWGLLAMVIGWNKRRAALFLVAGATFALAFGLKYTVGTIALTIFAPLLTRDLTFRWVDFFAFAVGGFGTLFCIGAILAKAGALTPFLEIQAYILGYTVGFRTGAALLVWVFILNLGRAPVVGLAATLGALAVFWQAFSRGRSAAAVLIVIWLITGFLSAYAQGKAYFIYQQLPLQMGFAAAVAVTVDAILRRYAHIRVFIVAAFLAGLPYARVAEWIGSIAEGHPRATVTSDHETDNFSASANAEAARILNDELQPDETLFVWGYETMLYYLTNRTPQHRYPYSWPFLVSYYDGRHDADLLGRLADAPPDVFVVQNADATATVTGRDIDSRTALQQWSELATFLAENYRKVGESPRFEYYRLN